ncbi:MAG TPA: hypothetical protein VF950_18120 [Planctomycetota bacterium]
MRPLSGPARWGILPGLSAAGGLVAGLAFQAIARGSGGRDIILLGGLMGLAAALAVAIAPKIWMAVLLAPPLATLGMAASTFLFFYPDEPVRALRYALLPPMQILGLLATAPNVVLHGMRLKRTAAWFPKGLGLSLAAAAASAFTVSEIFVGTRLPELLAFFTLLNAGGAVALEAALRRSRVVS